MMILSTICVFAPPKDRQIMISSLRSTVGPTVVRSGCVGCRLDLNLSIPDQTALVLISRWRSREDWDTYVRTDLFRTVLSVVDLSCKAPIIEFDTILSTSGIEFLTTQE